LLRSGCSGEFRKPIASLTEIEGREASSVGGSAATPGPPAIANPVFEGEGAVVVVPGRPGGHSGGGGDTWQRRFVPATHIQGGRAMPSRSSDPRAETRWVG